MKIITVVGARPQFIKAAVLSRCIKEHFNDDVEEMLVHTGQHVDENMSLVFFDELEIPSPTYQLSISGGTHGAMTGKMLIALEDVLLREKPDRVLVYGDTNSTLAGALAAAKLCIPIAHVEAGLRSFNRVMPEEINRVLTDTLSTYLFCPTCAAVDNLKREGLSRGIHEVGDVMFDAALFFGHVAAKKSVILQTLGLEPGEFVLTTCHRAENTERVDRLTQILQALATIAEEIPVVFPVHPRTLACIHRWGLSHHLHRLLVLEPVSYLDMSSLEQSAQVILTDSGGIQKEAFFYGVPCVTMREETEWVETVDLGWNQVVGACQGQIVSAFLQAKTGFKGVFPYGDGQSCRRILNVLLETAYA